MSQIQSIPLKAIEYSLLSNHPEICTDIQAYGICNLIVIAALYVTIGHKKVIAINRVIAINEVVASNESTYGLSDILELEIALI